MPLITIESGNLSKEQKSKLIETMTQSASEIMNVPKEFFFVAIKELSDENMGIGGKSVDKIKQEYRQACENKKE